jgi:hypothetical protein
MKTFKYLVVAMLMVSVLQLRGFFVNNECDSNITVKRRQYGKDYGKELSYSMKPGTFLKLNDIDGYDVGQLKIIVDDRTFEYEKHLLDRGLMVVGVKGNKGRKFGDYQIYSLMPRYQCPAWCEEDAMREEEEHWRKSHPKK